MKLNQQIKEVKGEMDAATAAWEERKSEFRDVKSRRRAKFLAYFDSVSQTLELVYNRLTDLSRLP